MFNQCLGWIASTFGAIIGWLRTMSDGLGFDLWAYMFGLTVLSIVLAIFVFPAVGGEIDRARSDHRSARREKSGKKKGK